VCYKVTSKLSLQSIEKSVSHVPFFQLFPVRLCVSHLSPVRVIHLLLITLIIFGEYRITQFRWARGLRRGSAAARLLRLRVRIPPGAWMSVSSGCCVLSGRGLCDGPIPHPEESYRVCVCVCHLV
jgi:hypothetical protein